MAGKGGYRENAGRKSKAEELAIPELMQSVLPNEVVIEKLAALVKDGELRAIQIWLEYLIGKPKQSTDITSNGQTVTLPPLNFIDGNE